MNKSRLEAFSDGVMAIIVTILVLGLPEPLSGGFDALFDEWHRILIYVVSFLIIVIYWNNHHNMLQAVKTISGGALWSNNLFLLSLSIFPFVTSWMGDFFSDITPQASFGFAIMAADTMFLVLAFNLRQAHRKDESVSAFFKRNKKSLISIAINIVALMLGILIKPELIFVINVLMLIMWVVPDKRFETLVTHH